MPKVIFEFDPKKEYEYINFFEENFGAVNLPENIRKVWEDKGRALELMAAEYDERKKENYEKRWRKIEKEYFHSVKKITGHGWNHETYKVFLTRYMLGFCNPLDVDTDEVMVCQEFDDLENVYIIAHELFHSHYHKIAAIKDDLELLKTELNENCAVLSLCYSEIRKLLVEPENEWIVNGWQNSHSEAAKYFEELLSIWENRSNFDDYLDKSLKLL